MYSLVFASLLFICFLLAFMNASRLTERIGERKYKDAMIVVYGRRGVGKSSVINAILDSDVSQVGNNLGGMTNKYSNFSIGNVKIIDTAGLFESDQANPTVTSQCALYLLMDLSYEIKKTGLTHTLLVVSWPGPTKEDANSLDLMKTLFPEAKHLVVITKFESSMKHQPYAGFSNEKSMDTIVKKEDLIYFGTFYKSKERIDRECDLFKSVDHKECCEDFNQKNYDTCTKSTLFLFDRIDQTNKGFVYPDLRSKFFTTLWNRIVGITWDKEKPVNEQFAEMLAAFGAKPPEIACITDKLHKKHTSICNRLNINSQVCDVIKWGLGFAARPEAVCCEFTEPEQDVCAAQLERAERLDYYEDL